MKKTVIVSLLLLFSVPAFAKFDPSFTWKTLETPHFLIHYHQGEEGLAKRTAVIAEDVHGRLVPQIGWDPADRTHVVLVDAADDSNGMSTPLPYNQIVLYITVPVGAPGFGTTARDDWMRLLFTHEYTHILHLDMVHGAQRVIRDIFGRIYFPNVFEPSWMIEGLATYEETEETSGGRGRSPGAEMIIRMAVLEDRFPRMSQATVFPDFWPQGQVPYLFGEGFTDFIAEKYGKKKLADIQASYSRFGVPWFVDANGRWVLDAWYSDLWDEWHRKLTARYDKLREDLRVEGLTASLPLTSRGYVNVAPAVSPDGRRIAYTVWNADEFPSIYLMNADGSHDRKLIDNVTSQTASGESIAWRPDGRGIYYTRIDITRNTDLYNDIYYYDFEREREVRITKGLRARDPWPSPDGTRLLFVRNRLARTRIGVIDLAAIAGRPAEEGDVSWLTEEGDLQYATPRYSPDGTRIVVGVARPDGCQDIWILDSQGGKTEELMHDRAVDSNAIWSPDGRTVYFSSDRSGIFNLYAYELASKKMYRITNVLGGAFTPAPSPDGKTIVFSSYSAKGYDLHTESVDTASWKPAKLYHNPYPAVAYRDEPVKTEERSYNPLPTLYPRFWLPWYGYSEASGDLWGFLTFGQDVIQRHSYVLTGLYSPTTYRKWYSFGYAYDGLYPTFTVTASDVDGTYSDLLVDPLGTKDYVQREKTIGASVIVPLLKLERQQSLTIGYRRKTISALTTIPPWPTYSGPVPAEGLLVSGRASYLFNSAKIYGYSISPEDGRTVELGYERIDKALGSDFNVTKYTADWHEYLGLPWKHHVLLARAFAGTSQGDVIPQRAFQLGGDSPGNSTIPVDSETVYLRGYPVNAFRGRKAALASLEYRFPIAYPESGWSNTPVFLRRLHGAVFAESGDAWDEGFHADDFKSSAGVEVRLDTDLAYTLLPVTFRLVYAQGLDRKGESQVYLSLWLPALF